MRVYLLSHTAQPERIVAAAAKLCYADTGADALLEGLTPEKTAQFVSMLSSLGHESPIEHASFTFAVEGVSRSLLAQLTRHRIASYSVQSQRYVRLDDFRYVTPPAIAENERARALYEETMRRDAAAYEELTELLKAQYIKEEATDAADEKAKRAAAARAEKRAIEDARFVLPNACETRLVMTMNARELRSFFKQRCCRRAQWEIRALADEMLRIVSAAAPSLFENAGPACVSGPCPEGRMCCGETERVRAHYKKLNEVANQ
ncbi:MAG: FAD-dependent thymidylate synthase [Oscillospiraceae bacterium]|nr:FAD-dependent thymidylate synthase [Oscillospiraceae bacterium]